MGVSMRKTTIVLYILGVLAATWWLPSSAQLIVTDATFPTQALHGERYPFKIDLVLGWTGLPASDEIYYYVSDVSGTRGVTSDLQAVSAYNDDGSLLTELTVEGIAHGNGDRTILVGYMTVDDFLDERTVESDVFIIPPVLSLLPPMVIIIFAVATKSVLLSLTAGIYTASFIVYKYNIFQAFLRFWDVFLVPTVAKENNVAIITLNFFLSGMVGVILKNGGGFGAAKVMSEIAKNRKNAALATFILGLLIMFHTYANALIVGQSMRPLTDMYLISREKLAFLVDSTSAPVASISPISSWIGYELSLISSVLESLVDAGDDISCYDSSPFIIFCKTIPRRYYPIGVLMVQCFCIIAEREFGPMLAAERRAKTGLGVAPPEKQSEGAKVLDERLNPHPETPLVWWMAFIPIFSVLFLTIMFLIYTGAVNSKSEGLSPNLYNWFGQSDSNMSLVYGSFIASMMANLMSRLIGYTRQGNLFPTFFTRYFTSEKVKPFLTLDESSWAWIEGMKDLLEATLILSLAWGVGAAFIACNTGTFVSSAAADSIDPSAFPAISFVIAAVLSGITGTSWGTMAIMFPLVLPASHFADRCNTNIFYGTIASILSGAIFGDHMSPLSDTTIISCITTKCPVWAHVYTQAPYAFLAGAIAILGGDIAVGYGAFPYWVGLILVCAFCIASVYVICVPVDGNQVDIFTNISTKAAQKLGEGKDKLMGSVSSRCSEEILPTSLADKS